MEVVRDTHDQIPRIWHAKLGNDFVLHLNHIDWISCAIGHQVQPQVDDGWQQEVRVEAKDALVLKSIFNSVYQRGGHGFIGLMVTGKAGQQLWVTQPAFVDQCRQLDKVPGNMLAAQRAIGCFAMQHVKRMTKLVKEDVGVLPR